jgi:hypothetical protein
VIAGSADHRPEHELAAEARNILDEIYAGEIADLGRLFATREAQGRATTDVAQAARAATYGAVDTLMFDIDDVAHGTLDEETGAVTFADGPAVGNYGVIDAIAARTLAAGGRLVAARRADIPREASVAAILRYPV